MTDKPARPIKARPAPTAKTPARHAPAPPRNALRQADTRWQRSVRYGWDKGGSKGGR